MDNAKNLDFGYPWILINGHLVLFAFFLGVVGILSYIAAISWLIGIFSFLAGWAFTGFLIVRFLFRANEPLKMPIPDFFTSGKGRVLDIGCGSGRTSIMIAQARPAAKVVALDNFSATYIQNHGKNHTQRNFELAGVADRVSIKEGDMRHLPFEKNMFDALVSSFALDHLDRKDVHTALSEARRVLRQNGDFLLMLVIPNLWLSITFTPLIWMMLPSRNDWQRMLKSAGFTVASEGSSQGFGWFHIINIQHP